MIERVIVENFKIYVGLDRALQGGLNVIVGDNEAGKSTLLTAVSLALTGRMNGKWAREALSPDWFNTSAVEEYFRAVDAGEDPLPLEILIELFLDASDDAVQALRGLHNSLAIDRPGLRIRATPSADYANELIQYLKMPDRPAMIPVEFYEIEWRTFADEPLTRRPKGVAHVQIDANTVHRGTGVDYFMREILDEVVEPAERAAISVADRLGRQAVTAQHLAAANAKLAGQAPLVQGKSLQLRLDQAAVGAWRSGISPTLDDVPFEQMGQGVQAAVKIALAMTRTADATSHVLIEEPENHLSHTSLTRLLGRINDLAGERQVVISTHSSYVLNRLGLDRLTLMREGAGTDFGVLDDDTVGYFKKLSGFDTLRLVLAQKLVLVEGPSDEMVFQRLYHDQSGSWPLDDGIDVVSLRGVALERSLKLCAALDRDVVAIRDNDGQPQAHWAAKLEPGLLSTKRLLVVGDPALGKTLEPQLLAANDEASLRTALRISDAAAVPTWMGHNKTEAALRLLESEHVLIPPPYFLEAFAALA